MPISLARLGVLLVAAIVLAGCNAFRDQPDAGAPAGRTARPELQAGEQNAIQAQIDALDEKIGRIEKGLGRGSGALRQGSTLRIESGGETVLERLRRLERELGAANAALAARDARQRELDATLAEMRQANRSAEERADYLARNQESLVTAQQALGERQEQIGRLQAQLAVSELQRLKAEREWYLLAGALLRISPDRTTELPELQERVREQTKELLPRASTASDKER